VILLIQISDIIISDQKLISSAIMDVFTLELEGLLWIWLRHKPTKTRMTQVLFTNHWN